MNRVVHFDILTEDPGKLSKFYSDVFGWKFEKWDGPMEYWMIMTGEGPGIDGGMGLKGPQSANANTISVENLEETLEKVEAHGGTIIAPKDAIPGIGWFAMFKDSDDNVFGLMQDDPQAK
jgi:predicted enzyme related to lactoylglutathione lyase